MVVGHNYFRYIEKCKKHSNYEMLFKALKINLNGSDGRIGEMHSTIVRLETAKKDVESNLSTVVGLLQQFRLLL